MKARGTEIAVPIDVLQQIPYFEKRSRSGWLDSEDSKAYVDIHAEHFHVILDIMEYAKQDNTPPRNSFQVQFLFLLSLGLRQCLVWSMRSRRLNNLALQVLMNC